MPEKHNTKKIPRKLYIWEENAEAKKVLSSFSRHVHERNKKQSFSHTSPGRENYNMNTCIKKIVRVSVKMRAKLANAFFCACREIRVNASVKCNGQILFGKTRIFSTLPGQIGEHSRRRVIHFAPTNHRIPPVCLAVRIFLVENIVIIFYNMFFYDSTTQSTIYNLAIPGYLTDVQVNDWCYMVLRSYWT